MHRGFVLFLALALCACATSSGQRSTGFVNADVARAYIPLEGRSYVVMESRGAAFVVAPGIAVTNAHNRDFLGNVPVVGMSKDYDLLFFRTDRAASPVFGSPNPGEKVIAYGQGTEGDVREAHGVVRALDQPVKARCPTCNVQGAFIFEGDAGPGFSGGPVVDTVSGAIVGVTFGYLDDGGRRVMYAYPMRRVLRELAGLQGRLPSAAN
jgi:hypothetical protein